MFISNLFTDTVSILRYEFHHAVWHWGENSLEGSEHYLNGVQQPMEIQLFHWNTKYSDYITASQNADGLSAVSFFYELSATNNSAIAKQLDVLSELVNSSPLYHIFYPEFVQPFPMTSLSQLLPDGGVDVSDNYFHYKGSQTLPRAPLTTYFNISISPYYSFIHGLDFFCFCLIIFHQY